MENNAQSIMDAPATYRIRVHGHPTLDWIEAMLGNVSMTADEAESGPSSTVTANMGDQAALLGFINTLYNLGHAVISIEKLAPGTPDEAAGAK